MFKYGALGLLAGQVCASFFAALMLGRAFFSTSTSSRPNVGELKQMMVRYRRFPAYSSWAALFNSASAQIPVIVFAALAGTSSAGFFALAERVLAVPSRLVSSAVAGVFYNHAAIRTKSGGLNTLVRETFGMLTALSLAPFLLLGIAAPTLFALVFGQEWSVAGQMAQWLSVGLFFNFVTSPMTSMFDVVERQDIELKFQFTLFLSRLTGIIVGTYMANTLLAVALYSLASAVCYLWVMVWIARRTQLPLIEPARSLANALGWAGLCISPFVLLRFYSDSKEFFVAGLLISAICIGVRMILKIKAANIWSTSPL